MVSKQKKAKNNNLLISYYTEKFKNADEVEEFIYACIGPSRNSPMAGPVPKEDSHLQVKVGDRVNIKICRQMECTCNYASRLIAEFDKRKKEEGSKPTRKEEKTSDKEESKEIARRIALGDSDEDTGRKQKTKNRKRKTEEREQEVETDSGVSEQETEKESLEDLLFG